MESADAEPAGKESRLYCAFVYRDLEHLRIWVNAGQDGGGGLEPWMLRDRLYLSAPQLLHLLSGNVLNDTQLPWIIVRLISFIHSISIFFLVLSVSQ